MSRAADIFIVGPVRSGTSWLQTMLAEHPEVASPPETHLFTNYIAPLVDAWESDQARVAAALDDQGSQVGHGLATIVIDDEFVAMLQSIYTTVRDLVVSAKPGACRFLEKTPDHALCLDTIQRVVPDAAVVFLVRDPRDTVRSLLEASGESWGYWAPKSVEDATALWLRSVRAWFPRKRDSRLLLVRYEDLRADPAELERVAEFLGFGNPATWLRTRVDAPPGERSSTIMRGDAAKGLLNPYETPGFSHHDRGNRRVLDRYERAYIEQRCRNEMMVLGYPVDVEPPPPRMRAENLVRAVRGKARLLRSKVSARGRRAGEPT
ncbi:MAG TPA: sulfotransferase [Acidimicrobiia bacterium]|nr:sulfotransferase [Acidimicrobiia bacterium]